MRKTLLIFIFIFTTTMLHAENKIRLIVGDKSMTATLVDNTASAELMALLQRGDITINMSDYGGFEKVGVLPQSFTTSNSQITTEPGDIMLYQGNNMVIFYGSNSWSYTPLGKIDNASSVEIREFLGNGNITLVLSVDSTNGIDKVVASDKDIHTVYDLKGNRVADEPLRPGLYVIDGKKTLKK